MRKTILLSIVVQLVTLASAPAAIHKVPSEYTTIQNAIDAAVDGDVVIVAPGIYTGLGNRDIDFGGKAITVQSTDPQDPDVVTATVINCQGTEAEPHRGFYFHSGEDCNSVLSGLTIKNGNHRCGGGIYCVSSSPTITNCVLSDNTAKYYEYIYFLPQPEYNNLMVSNESGVRIMCPPPQPDRKGNGAGICCVDSNSTVINCKFVSNSAFEHGGGMYSMGGSPTVINCTFTENLAGGGGGMANLDGSSPSLTNCIFTANTAETGGGGIRNADNSNPTLINCMFINNSAGWSGGLGNYYSSPILTNCTFNGNSADNNGGGINNYESNPVFRNCIFSNNSAKVGGGIFSEHNSSTTLDNTTFIANTAENGGGVYCANCSPTISNCTFRDNKAEYSNILLAPYQQNNISIISSGTDVRIMCPPPPTSPAPAEGNGGGIYLIYCSSSLTYCTFKGNLAYELGGALYTDSCISSILTDCTFIGNSAKSGGGMENHDSSPTLSNCTFTSNSAEYGGGGIRNAFCSVVLINCTFNHNSAGWSGGLGNYYCDLILTNCTFTGNLAETNGGGMNSSFSDIFQTNCIFSGNVSYKWGGAIYNDLYNGMFVSNCTFTGNRAGEAGGGIYINPPPPPAGSSAIASYYATNAISNCIFWDNMPEQIVNWNSPLPWVIYCDVQGGRSGIVESHGAPSCWLGGNIVSDPFFVRPGYWDANGTPDDMNDDVWIEGDYHLQSEGWRWSQRKAWAWDEVTSQCIDAGNPGSLFGEELISVPVDPDNDWGQNLRINMGAYGGTAQASMPPYGWAILADLTNDGLVNFVDLSRWSEIWLSSGSERPSDLDRNGIVDLSDFSLFAGNWRAETSRPPCQSSDPNPADKTTSVSIYTDLSWTASPSATSHDVYFGTSITPPFIHNQIDTTFDPGTMYYETTYYWRIDEVNKWGKTTGHIWSFTAIVAPPP